MNLVDSCGWIEYFSGSAYADFYAEAIEDTSNLIVPSGHLHHGSIQKNLFPTR